MSEAKGPYMHSVYHHALKSTDRCLACAYAAGVLAERERCASIAEKEAGDTRVDTAYEKADEMIERRKR